MRRLDAKLDELIEPISMKRRFPNYTFGRPIFYSYLALLAMVVLSLGQNYGFTDNHYFSCDFGVCETPDGMTVRAPYEEGSKPPFIVKNFFGVSIALLLLAFGANHFIYNTRLNK